MRANHCVSIYTGSEVLWAFVEQSEHFKVWLHFSVRITTRDLALANMAGDDPPASSTVSSRAAARRPQCAVKWDRNLKPKLTIMRQCTFVTDRQTDTDIVA